MFDNSLQAVDQFLNKHENNWREMGRESINTRLIKGES